MPKREPLYPHVPKSKKMTLNKWDVEVHFVVAADKRGKAWSVAEGICRSNLRDLAEVRSIPMEPLKDPEEWLAVNE